MKNLDIPGTWIMNPRPVRSTVEEMIKEKLARVQKRTSARELSAFSFLKDFPKRPRTGTGQGIIHRCGGEVPNSYGYPAKKTIGSLRWYTDPSKNLYIKFSASRTKAQSLSYGSCPEKHNQVLDNPFGNCRPWRMQELRGAQKKREIREMQDKIGIPRTPAEYDPDFSGSSSLWAEKTNQTDFLLSENIVSPLTHKQLLFQAFGPASRDNSGQITNPHIIALSEEGAVIVNQGDYGSSRISRVQVVVPECYEKKSHWIFVPPRFGSPDTKTYQDLRDKGDEYHVRASIAWTFDIHPENYKPELVA